MTESNAHDEAASEHHPVEPVGRARPWTWSWAARSHIGPTCSTCQTIHGADAAVAVGRFISPVVAGFRSRLGGPLRGTRDEAEADFCAAQRPVPAPD